MICAALNSIVHRLQGAAGVLELPGHDEATLLIIRDVVDDLSRLEAAAARDSFMPKRRQS